MSYYSPYLASDPGDDVTFQATVRASPAASYSWLKDDVTIPGVTQSSLTIPSLTSSSSGTYVLKACNALGCRSTAGSVLQVREPPRLLSQPTSVDIIIPGQRLSLSVVAAGLPYPELQWFFSGQPLSGQTAATLLLTNVQEASEGVYHVQARNSLGTVRSSSVAVRVMDPPSIANISGTSIVYVGGTATLSADVRGDQPMAFEWTVRACIISKCGCRMLTSSSRLGGVSFHTQRPRSRRSMSRKAHLGHTSCPQQTQLVHVARRVVSDDVT